MPDTQTPVTVALPPPAGAIPVPGRLARLVARLPAIVPWATAIVFAVALVVLWRLLRDVDPAVLSAEIRARPLGAVAVAVLATMGGFAAIAAYDWVAARFFAVDVPWTATAFGGASASAVANVVGNNMLSGGAIRLRFYARYGLTPVQVAGITVFATVGFAVAAHLVVAAAVVSAPRAFGTLLGIRPSIAATVAALGVGASATAFALAWAFRTRGSEGRWRFDLRVGRRTVPVPSPLLLLLQLLFAVADLACAATVCWVLMPDLPVAFPTFLGLFVVATVAGMLSHVPGGFGVFEGIVIGALSGDVPTEALAAALVLYRVVYSLAPMVVALVALFAVEARTRLSGAAVRRVGAIGTDLVPGLAALAAVAAGGLLLLSGATPAAEGRLTLLSHTLPLHLLEAAHMAASVVGVLLLVIADGLRRRAHGAWALALALLLSGAVLSLAKGLDWEEAVALVVAAAVLAPFGGAFHRPSALLEAPHRSGTLVAVLGAAGAVGMITLLAHIDAPYAAESWWQIAVDAEAPRSVRAAMVVSLIALGLTVRELLRPARPVFAAPTPDDLDRAARIAAASDRPDALIALSGDKALLFHPAGDAFVMFAPSGRTLVALFDPVGPAARREDLVWAFRDLCDRSGLRPAFYEVRAEALPAYLDAGLVPVKLGEEARVDLRAFDLAAPRYKKLRQVVSRAERDGLALEIVPKDRVPDMVPELTRISARWLGDRPGREKGFSMGRLDPAYLARTPLAVLRAEGRIVAFANLLATDTAAEATIDLMRQTPDAPRIAMDYLLTALMLRAKADGVGWFNLGMAPLSGLATRRPAPLSQRLGSLVYRHGERFYGFRGLRAFKEKFAPTWEPRYLMVPPGLDPVLALADAAALIGGTRRGIRPS